MQDSQIKCKTLLATPPHAQQWRHGFSYQNGIDYFTAELVIYITDIIRNVILFILLHNKL